MGLLPDVAVLIAGLALPAGFAVCELGSQRLAGSHAAPSIRAFYEGLGCGRYVAIDGNGQGTVTADLNQPVTGLGVFDLVTDFGTGEHIFDQAQVWRTVHALTTPGGFIAFDRPHQGYTKHCFYLVNETLYRDLAAANHYQIVRLQRAETPRGWLCRGVFQKLEAGAFQVPQQGRYRRSLRLQEAG